MAKLKYKTQATHPTPYTTVARDPETPARNEPCGSVILPVGGCGRKVETFCGCGCIVRDVMV